MEKSLYQTNRIAACAAAVLLLLLSGCSQNYTVSVNNQAVFDPTGRLFNGELADPDLQGCVNIAMQQQNVNNAGLLRVLSCGSSEVETLGNIEQLSELRFLDLSNNFIRDLSPLQSLASLGGLNLINNSIDDIGPLLNMASLASVDLRGNNNIPCQQLLALQARLSNSLNQPESCRR